MKVPPGDINLAPPKRDQQKHRFYLSPNHFNSAVLLSVLAGSLMLNSKGTILTCTAALARLCGVDEDELVGRHIRFLLPAVSLSPDSEAYNIALVAVSSAGGRTMSLPLLRANGDMVQVDGCFRLIKAGTKYLFRIQLRWTDEVSVASERKCRIRRRPSLQAGAITGWRRKGHVRAN